MKSFAIFVFALALLGLGQAQIKSTAILFRHGQRTPDVEIGSLRSETADDFGLGYLTPVSVKVFKASDYSYLSKYLFSTEVGNSTRTEYSFVFAICTYSPRMDSSGLATCA